MKHLIISIIAATSAFCAMAHSEQPVQELYTLQNFQIAEETFVLPATEKIISGTMTIDHALNKLTVVLEQAFSCPANQICPRIMPLPVVFELDIVDLTTQACGGRVLVAQGNQPSRANNLVTVEIVDSNNYFCDNETRLVPLQVTIRELLVRGSPQTYEPISIMQAIPTR